MAGIEPELMNSLILDNFRLMRVSDLLGESSGTVEATILCVNLSLFFIESKSEGRSLVSTIVDISLEIMCFMRPEAG